MSAGRFTPWGIGVAWGYRFQVYLPTPPPSMRFVGRARPDEYPVGQARGELSAQIKLWFIAPTLTPFAIRPHSLSVGCRTGCRHFPLRWGKGSGILLIWGAKHSAQIHRFFLPPTPKGAKHSAQIRLSFFKFLKRC